MVIWGDSPVQSFVHSTKHQVPVVLVLHQFLQSAQLQPSHPIPSHHLLHNILDETVVLGRNGILGLNIVL